MPVCTHRYDITAHAQLIDRAKTDAVFRTMAGNFLLYGGLLAAHSDGAFDPAERDCLVEALGVFFDDPELLLTALPSASKASDSFKATTKWLRKHGGQENPELFRVLCALVAADNVLHDAEKRFMNAAARHLSLSTEAADEILREAFAAH